MAADQARALVELERANQSRLRKEHEGKAITKFVTEVRESMLFQYNWVDLLAAVPTALSLLGACHVASSSEEAATINISSAMPKGGWTYLKVGGANSTLKNCLVYVGDCGAYAFRSAATTMTYIAGTDRDLYETVNELLRAIQRLPDPRVASHLDDKLDQLAELADNCKKRAEDTEKAFDVWLLCVAEFHTASVQKQGATEAAAEVTTSLKVQAEIEASFKAKEVETAEAVAKTVLKSLEKAEAAFEKANSDVPSAWETCAMGAINAIAQAGPSIIALALPAALNGWNPMSAVSYVAGVSNGAASNTILGSATANNAPPTDPAYVAAPLILPFVDSIYAYLTQGPDGSIDWTKFRDTQDAAGATKSANGLTWLLTNVKEQQRSAQLGNGAPSEELKAAFAKMIKTIEGIQAEVLKSSGGTAADTIRTWQEDIKQAKATILKLETTAKTFPGSSASTPQLRNLKIDVPANDYSGQNAALTTATQKLGIAQQALATSQQNYQKAAENALKVQQELTAIRKKAEEVKFEGQTLGHVKEILANSIATLVELKVQFNKLKNFFDALYAMIRFVVQHKVKKFDGGGLRAAEDAKKKPILSRTDMDIEIIFSSTLTIRAYFDLLQGIPRMYTRMHAEHISLGMDLIGNLSMVRNDPDQVKRRRDELNRWAGRASTAILNMVAEKQDQVKSGLQDRIDSIVEQTRMLERFEVKPLDPLFAAAMKMGASTVTKYIEKGLPKGLAYSIR